MKGVICRHGDPTLNENGRYLLQLCFNNGLCIINTFFHSELYKWCRPSMAQKSLINVCIMSSNLFLELLDVRIKRGAELSTEHHLLVCSLRFSKPWLNRKLLRSNVGYWMKCEDPAEKKNKALKAFFARRYRSFFNILFLPRCFFSLPATFVHRFHQLMKSSLFGTTIPSQCLQKSLEVVGTLLPCWIKTVTSK